MRSGAADRLKQAADALPAAFGLAIFDAWRPLDLQQEIYDHADPNLPAGFVSIPQANPKRPPPHFTGGTVDLTLTHNGQGLALGTGFDDFTPLAHADAFEDQPGNIRDLRRLLYWSLNKVGFIVLAQEGWHFEYCTRRWAAIKGVEPVYGQAAPAQ